MSSLVETHNLSKHYAEVAALDDCSLEVRRGEIFGLLGPNGSGKTTLIRLLMGFLRPSHGHATIDGLDCYLQSVAVHQRVAYMPGDARLFRTMRGRDVLRFFALARRGGNLDRSLAIADRLALDVSRQVANCSTGMRQKLALAATLAADTALMILDEPTSNLDPTVRSEVLRLVQEAQQAGRTILFSSHVMSEVEEVCDRVVILRYGKLVHTQNMADLLRQHRIRAQLAGPLPEVPSPLRNELTIETTPDGQVTILTPGELSPLLGWLAQAPLGSVQIEPVGLRAVYDRFHSSTTERR
jgi:ABC-2 type transport system ATP-binding protein